MENASLQIRSDVDDSQEIDEEDQIAEQFGTEQITNELVKQEAIRRAKKILNKNKREIKRLKLWAEKAIYDNHYEAYAYAIRKLCSIYRVQFVEEKIQLQFATTRQVLLDATRKAIAIQKAKQ